MGGDFGPPVTIPAALAAIKKQPNLHLILVGNPDTMTTELHKHGVTQLPPQLTLHTATQTVGMDESPSSAMKNKKDSSMRVAINLVKEQQAIACVSAGNTGALMATARFVLKTIPGVERPAIITAFPTRIPNKPLWMLDLGANVDSAPAHLFQFAVMGSVLATAIGKIERPRLGLLNIGQEEIKGNEQVKETAALLANNSQLNYIGYVEGNDIFSGEVDVIVSDGFVGNVALKSSEGAIKLILNYLKQSFHKNWYSKIIGLLAKPIFQGLKALIDPANYNGACLIGLRGIVIKSHGGADIRAFTNAIFEAALQGQQNLPELIHQQVAQWLQTPTVSPESQEL